MNAQFYRTIQFTSNRIYIKYTLNDSYSDTSNSRTLILGGTQTHTQSRRI